MATEDRRRKKLIKYTQRTAHAHFHRWSYSGVPTVLPPEGRGTLPAPAEHIKNGVNRLAPSSEALGIPTLRYQSRGEDAGIITGHYIIETINPGSIRRTRSQSTISNRIPTGYSPGLQSRATILLTATMPHGYLKGSTGYG